jgi:hypothetical protein
MVIVGVPSIFQNGPMSGEQKREVIILAVKMSENKQLIERLAEASDVKYSKAKRLIQALENYVELPNFPEECTYTFSHTRYWCHHPLCREG